VEQRDYAAELGLVDRVPPQDLEAEQGVLGACLVSPEAAERVSEILAPEDFYRYAHAEIYRAVLRTQKGGYAPDMLGVMSVLRERELLDACGGPTYLMDLAGSIPTAAHAEHYARIVRKVATQRELITLGAQLVERGFAQDLQDPLDWASAEASKLADRRTGAEYHRIGDVAAKLVAEMEEAQQANWLGEGVSNRLPAYFPSLDNILGGFAPGQLVVLAARPGVGKSAFAVQVGVNAAKAGKPVIAFSAEMTADEVVMRVLSGWSGADSRSVLTGTIEGEAAESFKDAARMAARLPFAIFDDADITLRTIERKARRFKAENGGELGLVVVDYLQLLGGMPDEGNRRAAAANRNEEVSRLSRGLKVLAKHLGCPVLALSQLNREVEKRPGGEPQLSDLRDSGALEQDANIVMFIWAGQEFDQATKRGPMRFKVAKHRGGPCGHFTLNFDGPTTTFTDPLLETVWHDDQVMTRHQAESPPPPPAEPFAGWGPKGETGTGSVVAELTGED
jgi:replicative DNA helicase